MRNHEYSAISTTQPDVRVGSGVTARWAAQGRMNATARTAVRHCEILQCAALSRPDDFRFLARDKVGPFRVEGKARRGYDGSGRIGIQLTLHDEGTHDRAVRAASMTFRALG